MTLPPEWLDALRARRAALVAELAERRAEVNAIDVEIARHAYRDKRRGEWAQGFAPKRSKPIENPTHGALPRGDRDQ